MSFADMYPDGTAPKPEYYWGEMLPALIADGPHQATDGTWSYTLAVNGEGTAAEAPAALFWESGVVPIGPDEGTLRVGLGNDGHVVHIAPGRRFHEF